MGRRCPSVEVHHFKHRGSKRLVHLNFGAQPVVDAPWLELLRLQDTLHRLRGDRLDHATLDRGSRQLGARPQRQRAAGLVRQLASELYQVRRDHRGKRPARVHGRLCHASLPSASSRTAHPTCERPCASSPPAGPPRTRCNLPPTVGRLWLAARLDGPSAGFGFGLQALFVLPA